MMFTMAAWQKAGEKARSPRSQIISTTIDYYIEIITQAFYIYWFCGQINVRVTDLSKMKKS